MPIAIGKTCGQSVQVHSCCCTVTSKFGGALPVLFKDKKVGKKLNYADVFISYLSEAFKGFRIPSHREG